MPAKRSKAALSLKLDLSNMDYNPQFTGENACKSSLYSLQESESKFVTVDDKVIITGVR